MAGRLGIWTLACWLAACAGEDDDPSPDGDGDASEHTDNPDDTDLPPPADLDGDGLSDADELALGTDPNDSDSDNDGLKDGEEVAAGIDPLNLDTDGDGLADGQELALGADPLVQDTDGDTLNDREESDLGTNPAAADTDGDGLDDVADIEAGGDPTLADTDADGATDGDEIAAGTNITDPDTDNDQLLDGEEALLGTDPFDVDTDGDRLIDGLESAEGTDPLNPDTDGDGIEDWTEIDAYGSDPTNSDTDGDTLLDGDEIFVYLTSPFRADTDLDGLNDDVELAGATDPLLADTDGDGLLDGDEVNVYLTDPTIMDSDGGTLDDGIEVGLGIDPLDPGDDVCSFPDLDLVASVGPGGDPFEPYSVRVWIDGVSDNGLLRDFAADTDGDGVPETLSSTVVFVIQDVTGTDICTVQWDGDRLKPGTDWTTDSEADLFGAWAMDLSAKTAATDCPPLDPAVWEFDSMPELLSDVGFEIGIGPLVSQAAGLAADIAAAGGDWVADWEPYVLATYLKGSGSKGFEMGYVRGEDTYCDEVLGGPAYVATPADGGGIPRMRVHSDGTTNLLFEDVVVAEDCSDGTVVAGWLPGWGSTYTNFSLGWNTVVANSQAGPCVIQMMDIPLGFTKDSLVNSGVEVLVLGAPAIGGYFLSQNEFDAIRDFVEGGNGGIVATHVLRHFFNQDYSQLADLLAIDSSMMGFGTIAGFQTVNVLDTEHPVSLNVAPSFFLLNYYQTQLFVAGAGGVSKALLPGAEIIMGDTTGNSVVVAFEADDYRSVWFTGFPEYVVFDFNTYTALTNALIWASGPD